MKRINILFTLLAFAAALSLSACREKEVIADDVEIPGLGGTKEPENEVDKWLEKNFREPYNIEIVYRWDEAQMITSIDKKLVPIKFECIQPMMAALRDVWFTPFIQARDELFLMEMAPKKVVLVGSAEYNGDGTFTLGQAEGGRKILLLNGNNFDASNEEALRESLHTIIHEFTHILHQTKLFDAKYQEISAGRYDSQWQLNTDEEAYALGFISSYAMSSKDEDFAEMVSGILVYGYDWFENTVLAAARKSTVNPNAAADLEQKVAIMEQYFKDSWEITFFDDEMTPEPDGLLDYIQAAIEQTVANPPMK